MQTPAATSASRRRTAGRDRRRISHGRRDQALIVRVRGHLGMSGHLEPAPGFCGAGRRRAQHGDAYAQVLRQPRKIGPTGCAVAGAAALPLGRCPHRPSRRAGGSPRRATQPIPNDRICSNGAGPRASAPRQRAAPRYSAAMRRRRFLRHRRRRRRSASSRLWYLAAQTLADSVARWADERRRAMASVRRRRSAGFHSR
jgi:hypothetical protein